MGRFAGHRMREGSDEGVATEEALRYRVCFRREPALTTPEEKGSSGQAASGGPRELHAEVVGEAEAGWTPRLACHLRMLYTEPRGSVFADPLDASFAALSDTTRRGVLEQLGRADASITDLADKFHMTLTGMKKHVGVLEQAGLVTTAKVGRVRTCRLGLADWMKRRHGSRDTASSGMHGSTSWTRLSRN